MRNGSSMCNSESMTIHHMAWPSRSLPLCQAKHIYICMAWVQCTLLFYTISHTWTKNSPLPGQVRIPSHQIWSQELQLKYYCEYNYIIEVNNIATYIQPQGYATVMNVINRFRRVDPTSWNKFPVKASAYVHIWGAVCHIKVTRVTRPVKVVQCFIEIEGFRNSWKESERPAVLNVETQD